MSVEEIHVPIFGCVIGILVCPSQKKGQKKIWEWLDKEFCYVKKECNGLVFPDGAHIGLWLDPDAEKDVMAHEAYHITCAILNHIGISKRTSQTEEVEAYILMWVFNQIKNHVENKRTVV